MQQQSLWAYIFVMACTSCSAVASAIAVGVADAGTAQDGALPDRMPAEPDASVSLADCKLGVAWTTGSSGILIEQSYFGATSSMQARRDELSPARLSALDKLCVTPPFEAGTWSDPFMHRVTVTDADGSVRSYRAARYDEFGTRDRELPVIAYQVLAPALAEGCLFAPAVVKDYSATQLETASDDPLCVHHLTLGKSCAAPRLLFRASQAGVYRFEFDSCVDSTRLHIATADGRKELEVAESATAPACSSLAYTVDKANTYLVTIDADDGANCKSLVPLKLRIRH